MTRGLLVDFAGTTFLPLTGRQWATAGAAKSGARLTDAEATEIAARLDSDFCHVRDPGRDLSAANHCRSMLPALENLVADRRLARSLYELQFTDGFWRLRDGANDLLQTAHRQHWEVAVVSNVPWDIRALFQLAGLARCITVFSLSFEVGAEKPDRAIFQHAMDLLGSDADETVLVGDDPVTDSGALELGIPVLLAPRPADGHDRALARITTWVMASA
jgi:HAD superfamily hydrolase (TIGR01549 family)